MIQLLYIGFKYDYGKPERGHSFEYVNFYETLARMNGYTVTSFYYDEVMREVGRRAMNARLLRLVNEIKPDVCFFTLFTDEIDKQTIRTITEESGAVTLNWFGDDHWRFRTYSCHWAPFFRWVVTTDARAVEKYRAIGCQNVAKTQWAFNPSQYKSYDLPQECDVAFVGQVHSSRKRIIQSLSRAGTHVSCWGRGWPNGRISLEKMVKVYSSSKINLNFTESSMDFKWKPVAKMFLTRRLDDSIRLNSPGEIIDSLRVLMTNPRAQIKGRNFEIPGAGGFLLTEHVDGIEEYFVPNSEIAVFNGLDDLVDKVRYYLSHESAREAMRIAGHQRALRDHTFEKRFTDIFRLMGLGH